MPTTFDAAAATRLDRMYAVPDVAERRRLVREALRPAPGERMLDVGCGPGYLTRELAEDVGPEGSVVGVDMSEDMLTVARQRCEGHPNATFVSADATKLPDGPYDALACVQVLEYVPDVQGALHEMFRVLMPGGRAVIWDTDWATLSWHSEDPNRMTRVLRAWDEHLAHPSLPRTLAAGMRRAGFANVEAVPYPSVTIHPEPGGYGDRTIRLISSFVPGHNQVSDEEARAWRDEQGDLAAKGEFFLSVTPFCFSGTREP